MEILIRRFMDAIGLTRRFGESGRVRVRAAFWLALSIGWITIVSSTPPVYAQIASTVYEEYQVKAAVLYNFLLFTEWPDNAFEAADSPFIITLLGPDPFGEHLDAIAAKNTAQSRKITVRRVAKVEDIGPTHLLFVSESMRRSMPEILETIKGKPVLTVADYDGFIDDGGMINLMLVKNRVNFTINRKAAGKSGLKFSSQLLKLALKVIQEDPRGGES
ncbi:MAG: DUF4154 domain-containing protein [bacterium]|nr:DUF4154 domain-containing protein [bacterium]